MKQAQIIIGGRYQAKVSGQLTTVRVVKEQENLRTGRKFWDCVNEATGRAVRVNGAARFRKEAK